MAPEKANARLARALGNRRRRGLLTLVAARLRRELPDEARRLLPIVGEFPPIGGKIGGLARLGLQPFANSGTGKASRREAFHRSRIAGAGGHCGTPDITQNATYPPPEHPFGTSRHAALPKYFVRFARTRASGGSERSGNANSRPVSFS